LSIVTTNYDLNIESACISLGSVVNPGFKIKRVEGMEVPVDQHCYGPHGISVFKLHGSVNWYKSASDPGIEVEDRVVRVRSFGEEERARSLPYPLLDDYRPPNAPVIVPPSFLKPDLSKALKAVWSGAAQALAKANTLAFVGYSFPPSDTEMSYFLARALSENPALRSVFVVDPNAPAIVSRLRAQGAKMGSHFRDL